MLRTEFQARFDQFTLRDPREGPTLHLSLPLQAESVRPVSCLLLYHGKQKAFTLRLMTRERGGLVGPAKLWSFAANGDGQVRLEVIMQEPLDVGALSVLAGQPVAVQVTPENAEGA